LDAAKKLRDAVVFHAGTTSRGASIVTDGGRVLGVTAVGDTVAEAIATAYQAVGKITWEGAYFRKDIGQKALKRVSQTAAVGIVMGSDSDLSVMEEAAAVLKKFGIPFEMTVASAHRSPVRAMAYAAEAHGRGLKLLIAGAGHAAHLAGVLAAHTSLPVIGVGFAFIDGADAAGSSGGHHGLGKIRGAQRRHLRRPDAGAQRSGSGDGRPKIQAGHGSRR
jgi:phosphoribosylamine--glycine ligase